MASRRVTKRKSPCQDTIFLEVNDNDLSPEHHSNEDSEPEIKIMKTDSVLLKGETNSFNLEITESELNQQDQICEVDTKKKLSPLDKDETMVLCNNKPEPPDTLKNKLETLTNQLEDGELNENSITSNSNNHDKMDSKVSGDSEIQITFGNKDLADLYKLKFIKCLKSFVELEIIKETDLSIILQRDPLLNSSEWIILDEAICNNYISEEAVGPLGSPDKSKSKKKKNKKKKKEDDLFTLDTNPSQSEFTSHFTKYLSTFQIDLEGKEDNSDNAPRFSSAQTCFNCDENHSLRDCPVPKDMSKINAARNKFKHQKQTKRYHLEEDQKYGHFTPGTISQTLRTALGLRNNQLPPYIYKMRVCGYPPGWLEEAKFFYSNLHMFDPDGKTVRQNDVKKKQGLDRDKIFDYPGFNSPLEDHIKDEFKYHRVPPYSDQFHKNVMIEVFEKQYANQQDDYETCEMEVDVDASENDTGNNKSQLDNLKRKEVAGTCLPSPSLVELEKEKENLLLALEDNTSCNIISEENTSEEPEKLNVPTEDVNASVCRDEDHLIPVDLDNSLHEAVSDPENSFINNSIKTSSFGTPILKSKSPYSKVPNMDNFTKDVSPVINFENLPNTTGKYEQMTEVLQKVRDKMKNLQNCKL